MNEMLRTILDMDKNAQTKVEEAENYRREAVAGLSARKSSIVEDETKKVRESALKRSEQRKNEGRNRLSAIQLKNEKIMKNMNSLYEKNVDKWADEIVDNVINK